MEGKLALKTCYRFLGKRVSGTLVRCADRLACTLTPPHLWRGILCYGSPSLIDYHLLEHGFKEFA